MAAPDLHQALSALLQEPRPDGRGKLFAVCAGQSGLGSSYTARQLALIAAEAGYHTALIDMDLAQNAQFEALSSSEFESHYGAPQGPYDASFGVLPVWHVSPVMVADNGAQAAYMALYQLGQTPLFFSRFLWDRMRDGQNVHIAKSRPYWKALRDHYAVAFVDVPALDNNDAGQTLFEDMDGVILVAPDAHHESLTPALEQITASGGVCSGMIQNTPPDISQAPSGFYGDSA